MKNITNQYPPKRLKPYQVKEEISIFRDLHNICNYWKKIETISVSNDYSIIMLSKICSKTTRTQLYTYIDRKLNQVETFGIEKMNFKFLKQSNERILHDGKDLMYYELGGLQNQWKCMQRLGTSSLAGGFNVSENGDLLVFIFLNLHQLTCWKKYNNLWVPICKIVEIECINNFDFNDNQLQVYCCQDFSGRLYEKMTYQEQSDRWKKIYSIKANCYISFMASNFFVEGGFDVKSIVFWNQQQRKMISRQKFGVQGLSKILYCHQKHLLFIVQSQKIQIYNLCNLNQFIYMDTIKTINEIINFSIQENGEMLIISSKSSIVYYKAT